MSLIVLASDKGSPGVTTTAVALAGVWPRRAILAECDPAGGDLVYRTPADNGAPLNPNIGMLSLATTARHGLSAHQLEQHIQRMHGGLELVVGLATGDQSAGLTGLWPALGRAFDALPDADVIADCGRVEATGPALELMAAASLVVLVARTSAEQIAHVRDRALSLVQRVGGGAATAGGGLGVPIGVVLIVDPKQRTRVTAQVDELLRNSGLPVKVIGTVADDPDGADLINGRGRGRLDRTLLIRSTREVALDLSRLYGTASQGAAMDAGGPGPRGAQPPMPGSGPIPGGPIPGGPMPGGPMPGGPMPQQHYAAPPRPPQAAPGMADPRANPGPRRPAPPMAHPGSQQFAPPPMTDPVPQHHIPAPPPMSEPTPQQYAPPPMAEPGSQGMAPVPQHHIPAPPPMAEPSSAPSQPAPPPMTDPVPQHHAPAPPPAPANGYPPPAQDPEAPGTAKQPMFRRPAQPQPTVWPGEQPPNPPNPPDPPAPASAHEGFTSVTLGGGPDPRGGLPYQDGIELDRLPPRDEIAPGRGGHRAGPPQGGQ